MLAILFQIALLVPSAYSECCPAEAFCIDYVAKYPFCFNCQACTIPFKQYYCANGDGGCNIFGCNCDDGCIKYDPNAWCVQPDADGDKNLIACFINNPYWDWIADPNNRVDSTVLPTTDGTNLTSLTNHHVNSLVSLVRPNFTDDPITKEEFVQLLQKYFRNQTQVLNNINVEEEFGKLDSNNNGVIHLNEIDSDYQ